jgi:hypothetical protein
VAVLTLAEAVQYDGYNGLERGVIKKFTQVSPILEMIPMRKIEGNSSTYREEVSLPGIAWRGVNQGYTPSHGVIQPRTETLKIVGGEVQMDNYIVETEGQGENAVDIKAHQYEMEAQALANEFDRAFFEGDDLVDPNELVGLRRRLTGNQVILAGSGGATLTLAMLDELLDRVPFPDKVLFMNRVARRKVMSLIRAATGTMQISTTQDSFGRMVTAYADVPIRIIERTGDGSTILDYDEDPGDGTADTTSIYVVSFGLDRVHGIYNKANGKVVDVKDFGEIQAEPQHLGRIEAFYGLMVKHGRAAARLRGVTNS